MERDPSSRRSEFEQRIADASVANGGFLIAGPRERAEYEEGRGQESTADGIGLPVSPDAANEGVE